MDCFNHVGQAAVATCRSCGRAVCKACAKDLSFAVVCSDGCATYSTQLQEMTQRSLRLYGIGTDKRNLPLASIIWALFALLFGGFGVLGWFSRGEIDWFLSAFGLIAAVVCVVSYRRYRQLQLNC